MKKVNGSWKRSRFEPSVYPFEMSPLRVFARVWGFGEEKGGRNDILFPHPQLVWDIMLLVFFLRLVQCKHIVSNGFQSKFPIDRF